MEEISPGWAVGKFVPPPQAQAFHGAAPWKTVAFSAGAKLRMANAGVTLAFNAHGGITHLDTGSSGGGSQHQPLLASEANPLAEFHYQLLSGQSMHSW